MFQKFPAILQLLNMQMSFHFLHALEAKDLQRILHKKKERGRAASDSKQPTGRNSFSQGS